MKIEMEKRKERTNEKLKEGRKKVKLDGWREGR